MCKNPQDEQPMDTEQTPPSSDQQGEQQPSQQQEPEEEPEEKQRCPSFCHCLINFYFNNEFVLLVVCAILLARAYPPLGAIYLAPQITATWIAVVFIFVMAGLGLKTEELTNALKQWKFNLCIQLFNFGVISSTVYGVSRGLVEARVISQALADGMVICASLPMTINMVLVLTKSAAGDEAAAIFNAAFGNMIGVFLSPVLILGYLGVTGEVNLWEVFYKLCLRVVLPVAVGQLLQKFSKTIVSFVKAHKPKFKKAQEYALVFIVYTVFCKTFMEESESSVGDIFLMILFQFVLLCLFMGLSWVLLKLLFRDQPALRIMGLFGCTHKTVAMGVPLINAIYESNPLVGLYTLPLLIWHPMQLLIGSFLAPKLASIVKEEKERLGITDDEEEDAEDKTKKEEPDAPEDVSAAERGEAAQESNR